MTLKQTLRLSCCLLFACCSVASAQIRTDAIKELLSAPAPTPRKEASTDAEDSANLWVARENVPPDDAPIKDLLLYWTQYPTNPKAPPSDSVLQRLLNASLDDPEGLARLLPLFPASDTFAAKIKEVFDKTREDPEAKYGNQHIKEC